MIDPDGYRPNVGIILLRDDGRVFWARRAFRDGWQFPQGGMRSDETPIEAMYRELHEETGLRPHHVQVLGATPGWLRYRLPSRMVRRNQKPMCIGQKQVWFLLRFVAEESALRLDVTDEPEFDQWRWVDFWYPAAHVVSFKRDVYQRALRHLAPLATTFSHDALDEALAVAGQMTESAFAAAESMAENARVMAETMADLADRLADAALAKTG
ncbi:MAG: RNA pyrophosphohydrolase [Rudaea sp.]|uniref:RNA pyrophosphohydrolase n=1 Tax=unclassified Rudaea TaxID=2627037 RepID=UPI0010F73AE3|nr:MULTISPECIES: RNA pyrophosphohydrolase [unclassified Rudaea]MBN8886073.1 RNA pyrophosphohydrolase [Rudaea sp.]MBR0345976.1 RNA pyrophosphohydrolase [Rudaea sp.]